jgi:hypothetical protein
MAAPGPPQPKRRRLLEALSGPAPAPGGGRGRGAPPEAGRARPAAQQQRAPPAAAPAARAPVPAPPADDNELGAELSDVEAALLLLKGEVYGDSAGAAGAPAPAGARLPPVILKAQLYTVLPDRTAVDRELDALQRAGALRAFKLATGADEYAVLSMADYAALIDAAAAAADTAAGGGGGLPSAAAAALRRFRERVVPRLWDSQVAAPRLLQLLAAPPEAAGGGAGGAAAAAGAVAAGVGSPAGAARYDAEISHLLAAELLSRDPALPGQLTLTVPGAGRIVRNLVDGRAELAAILGKKRCAAAGRAARGRGASDPWQRSPWRSTAPLYAACRSTASDSVCLSPQLLPLPTPRLPRRAPAGLARRSRRSCSSSSCAAARSACASTCATCWAAAP